MRDEPRDVERAIRQALHRVRNPSRLAPLPLVTSLRQALGVASPVTAMRQVVEEAFERGGSSQARLRDVIIDVDFDGTSSIEGTARRLGVSRRNVQRYRARAVSLISERVAEVLGHGAPAAAYDEAAPDPNELDEPALVELAELAANRWPARLDAATRFEFERLAFLRARSGGRTLEMKAAANSLRSLAGVDPRALATALSYQAEAYLRLGRIAPARQHLEHAEHVAHRGGERRIAAYCALLRSDIALFEGSVWPAEQLARRARVRLTGRRATASWNGIALEIEGARHAAAAGRRREAERSNWAAYRRAASFGYEGLAARAAAGRAGCRAWAQDAATARGWAADAIGRLLTTQDYLLAADLFPREAFPVLFARGIDWLVDAVYRRIETIVPQARCDDARQRAAVRELLESFLRCLLDADASRAGLSDTIAAVNRLDSAFAYYAGKASEALTDVASLLAIALRDRRRWAGADEQVSDVVGQLVAELTPGELRSWTVG
jgi:hypothetical protein